MITETEKMVLELLNNGYMLWQIDEMVISGRNLDEVIDNLVAMGVI